MVTAAARTAARAAAAAAMAVMSIGRRNQNGCDTESSERDPS